MTGVSAAPGSRDEGGDRPARDIILIIADPADLHAAVVQHYLRDRPSVLPVVIDTAAFPGRWHLSLGCDRPPEIRFPDGPDPRCCRWPDGRPPPARIPFSRVRSVWVRRYRRHPPPAELSEESDCLISRSDTAAALDGLLLVAGRHGVRLLNDFPRDVVAPNKVLQLAAARAAGLRVPTTLVTNDPDEAAAFYRRLTSDGRRVLVKGFRPPGKSLVFSRLMSDADLGRLDALRHAPAIFQEYIDGGNLRVTVVGGRVFAARVAAVSPEARVDWRRDYFNPVAAADIGDQLAAQLVALQRDLGIVYGAHDLKVDAAGGVWFLEVNTGGQYLFVEIQTGQPISSAIADWLTG